MKVLVIGGTLFIGRQLVKELCEAGHDVAVMHRKAEHGFSRRVENLIADRNDANAIEQAIDGRRRLLPRCGGRRRSSGDGLLLLDLATEPPGAQPGESVAVVLRAQFLTEAAAVVQIEQH